MASTAAKKILQPLHCTSFNSSSFLTNNFYKSSIILATPTARLTRQVVLQVQAQARPTWLPGLDPPPHLDGRSEFLFVYY